MPTLSSHFYLSSSLLAPDDQEMICYSCSGRPVQRFLLPCYLTFEDFITHTTTAYGYHESKIGSKKSSPEPVKMHPQPPSKIMTTTTTMDIKITTKILAPVAKAK